MKHIYFFVAALLAIITFTTFYGCEKNANDRPVLTLVDEGSLRSLAAQQYDSFIAANPPITGTPEAAMVNDVATNVIAGLQDYLDDIGRSDLVEGYDWEFNLVNNPEANAWCLPGGKIVVYSGILPYASNEKELAVVMGHEIAHAVLKHGNERMSEQLLVQFGGEALSVLLSSKPQDMQNLFNTVYGIGGTLGTLAFSRKQESEADESGLYYMAYGGYDPNAAVTFWEKMQQQGGSNIPVFLSTHPSDEQRITDIKSHLPKAIEYYNNQQ